MTQIARQGLEMVAEGALEVSTNLGKCAVNKTFTAYVEGRPVKEVSFLKLSEYHNTFLLWSHLVSDDASGVIITSLLFLGGK
jgi:hypothetical protein